MPASLFRVLLTQDQLPGHLLLLHAAHLPFSFAFTIKTLWLLASLEQGRYRLPKQSNISSPVSVVSQVLIFSREQLNRSLELVLCPLII